MNKSINKKQGFTLLEVLIAIVIFSIGLLGLAKIQISSLRLTHDSLLRTTATLMAADMADRMRSNPTAMNAGIKSPYNASAGISNPTCLSSGCTSNQMAAQDLYEWNNMLATALPNGSGFVCIDSTPKDGSPTAPACDSVVLTPGKNIFVVKVWWTERIDQNSPGTLHQYILEFST